MSVFENKVFKWFATAANKNAYTFYRLLLWTLDGQVGVMKEYLVSLISDFSDGVSKILEDMEMFFVPFFEMIDPLLKVLSVINLYLVMVTFVALLCYMIFVRKHRIAKKFKKSKNYFISAVLLGLYAILTEAPMSLGAGLKLNTGLAVLPVASKLFGPIFATAFGIVQYGTSFVMHSGEAFSFVNFFVAGISGCLYGWILYEKKTTYFRCFWAKLLVNMVCNVLFAPVWYVDSLLTASVMAEKLVSNIVLVPIQALVIFVGILVMKKIRKIINNAVWGL